MDKDQKIKVSKGCIEYLLEEVESLRKANKLLGAKVEVMDGFFGLVNRLEGKPTHGDVDDRLWHARWEAIKDKE